MLYRVAALLVASALFFLPTAFAWTLGNGTLILDTGTGQTYRVNTPTGGIEATSLTFAQPGGEPILDGVWLNITPSGGYGYWNITYLARNELAIRGNLTNGGTFQFTGPLRVYDLYGVSPIGSLRTGGTSAKTYTLAPGEHQILISGADTPTLRIGAALAAGIQQNLLLIFIAAVLLALAGIVRRNRG